MKLYEIDAQLLAIIRDGDDLVDMETGELIEEEDFEALQMARQDKLEGLCLYWKDLVAEAAAIKTEEKALADRRRAKENRAERLKAFLQQKLAGEKLETPRAKVSWRKTQAVRITDAAKLPDALMRHPEPEPDKVAIKDALKRGIVVPGAEMVDRQSMTIK